MCISFCNQRNAAALFVSRISKMHLFAKWTAFIVVFLNTGGNFTLSEKFAAKLEIIQCEFL